jgi:hypothetical protein
LLQFLILYILAGSGGRISASTDGKNFKDVNSADEDPSSPFASGKHDGDNEDLFRGGCIGRDAQGKKLLMLAGGGTSDGRSGELGYPGRISRSSDGINWIHTLQLSVNQGKTYSRKSRMGEANWLGQCAYGNSRFVATGGDSLALVSNDGGEKWILTYSSTPNFGANRSMAFGNGLFVTASDRGSFYSSDGVSWSVGIDSDSNRAFDGSIGFRSISFGMLASGQGRFVMSGENSTPTMYSNDGIHWYRSTIRFSGSVVTSLSSLQFFSGRFYGTSGHRAAASADGITWNAYLDSGGFFSIFGRFGV